MLYDLTNPAYIASAPFTFVFKFLLAAVCGLIAHKGKITGNMLEEDFTITVPRSIVAGICGSLTYIVLYLAKSYITTVLAGSAPEAAAIALATKAASSTVNAILAHHHFRAAFRFASQGAEKCASDDKIKSAYKESRRNHAPVAFVVFV